MVNSLSDIPGGVTSSTTCAWYAEICRDSISSSIKDVLEEYTSFKQLMENLNEGLNSIKGFTSQAKSDLEEGYQDGEYTYVSDLEAEYNKIESTISLVDGLLAQVNTAIPILVSFKNMVDARSDLWSSAAYYIDCHPEEVSNK